MNQSLCIGYLLLQQVVRKIINALYGADKSICDKQLEKRLLLDEIIKEFIIQLEKQDLFLIKLSIMKHGEESMIPIPPVLRSFLFKKLFCKIQSPV